MAFDLKQTLKLHQQLVMTPQLQQAIRLLQLGRLELAELLRTELLENPVLEEELEEEKLEDEEKEPEKPAKKDEMEEVKGEGEGKEDFDWENYVQNYTSSPHESYIGTAGFDLPSYENNLQNKVTLSQHLFWQLRLTVANDEERSIGIAIIGDIDDNGYLKSSIDELTAKTHKVPEAIEAVLKKIQSFDPIGIGARDLKECLLLQSKHIPNQEIIERIINDHLHDLEIKNYKAIQKKLGIPMRRVVEAVKYISELDPKPGRPFYETSEQYVTPDIYVYKVGEEFIIVLNEDGLPRLRISQTYKSLLSKQSSTVNERDYINDKLKSAMWLIRSIHQRQRTIYRVAESIVKFQRDFFDKGINYLKPMILKEVADDIDMHESTISRVTANKYMHTPQGIFELKFFFNSGIRKIEGKNIASETVKEKIREIIASENIRKPYSDQEILEFLNESNINIARRTIAKYREMLGYLPSSKRKKLI